MTIQEMLFVLAEESLKNFTQKLIPTMDPQSILGIRIPKLRKLVKELEPQEIEDFLLDLPHTYHEENILHALLIGKNKDFVSCIQQIQAFLPYIDNWAVCDTLACPILKKNLDGLEKEIEKWIRSKHEYTVRFGIGCLMRYYLDDSFDIKYLDWVKMIHREEYYINMMRAWYFASAMVKQKEFVYPILEKVELDDWTHNITIQKCIESNRIDKDTKEKLKKLKVRTLR